jgi:uncharacterized cupredoxin-like copper-binding protein
VKRSAIIVSAAVGTSAAVLGPAAVNAAGPGAHAARTRVAVTAKEFKFTLRPTSARHGTVTFRIRNAGTLDHDFKIAGRKTPKIHRGKSATLTVRLRRGTYHYLCTLPGHAASGMKGTFRVR